jgi:glycosyltransferase involved in cell wall biosynthesis
MTATALKPVCDVAWRNIVAVIPAYNEEKFIGSVILKTLKHVSTIIVVDDGSADSTAEIAEEAGALVVRHTVNQGKGVALNTGFLKARELNPDAIVTIDADGQHLPEEIPLVTAPILAGEADIVIGSRYLEQKSDVPVQRVLGHQVFNFVTNQASGVPLTDSQSGFRAFSPNALRALSFNSQGFSVESEMQFLAGQYKLRTVEAPITIHYHAKPKRPLIRHGLLVLNGLLQLVGQYRPLLFFGIPGTIMMLIGLLWGLWVINIYRTSQMLATGYAIVSQLLIVLGALFLFTGILLHSIRGLLLSTPRSRNE